MPQVKSLKIHGLCSFSAVNSSFINFISMIPDISLGKYFIPTTGAVLVKIIQRIVLRNVFPVYLN